MLHIPGESFLRRRKGGREEGRNEGMRVLKCHEKGRCLWQEKETERERKMKEGREMVDVIGSKGGRKR